MNIRPLGKRILVKKVKEEEVRKSGGSTNYWRSCGYWKRN